MGNKLVFSDELRTKFDNVGTDTLSEWAKIGVSNTVELVNKMLEKINLIYQKASLSNFEFRNVVEVYQQSSTYFGFIENPKGEIIAYVFVIPPKYETRSGVLAQQAFPVMSGIIPELTDSKSYKLTNRPIFIINANEASHTPSMVVNILSGGILGFMYVDLFDRDLEPLLLSKGVPSVISNITDYEHILTVISSSGTNEIFQLDNVNKKIKFLKTRLKDGIHVNNEPYWFVLKAYAAFYLALRDDYIVDMSEINSLSRGNKTLDSFRDYISKFD